jgi:glycosyltransferase involved in cell wall biosynthesis
VAGDAALLVDTRRSGELAEAIETVLADAALRARLIDRGRARARRFTWEAVARETLDVYESVGAAR